MRNSIDVSESQTLLLAANLSPHPDRPLALIVRTVRDALVRNGEHGDA